MSTYMITALPLGGGDRVALVDCANERFEYALERMEPENPKLVRKLWNAENYVDALLRDDMLPITRDEALGLAEALLVGHAADLCAQADALAGSTMQ